MSDLAKAAEHKAFRVERAGDLLIVTPVGDPVEFSISLFQSEFSRVKRVAALPEFRNILVNMSNSSYFGSELIGMLLDLRRSVATQRGNAVGEDGLNGSTVHDGGVVALAGLSPDMAAGLKIMSVDSLFLTFDTRAEAVNTLAHRTLVDKMRESRTPWYVSLLAVPVLIGVFVLLAIPAINAAVRPTAREDFDTVCSVYTEWQEKLTAALTPEEVHGKKNVDLIVKLGEVELNTRNDSDARTHIQIAAQSLAQWIRDPTDQQSRTRFVVSLHDAGDSLGDQDPVAFPEEFPPRPQPQATSATSDQSVDVGEEGDSTTSAPSAAGNSAAAMHGAEAPGSSAGLPMHSAEPPKPAEKPVTPATETPKTGAEPSGHSAEPSPKTPATEEPEPPLSDDTL